MSSERHRTPTGNNVEVHDGPGSPVHAVLDDLRAASSTLHTVGSNFLAHQGTIAAIRWHLPVEGDVLSPMTAYTCTEHLLSLTFGDHSLGARGGSAYLLGGRLTATVIAYETAETVADSAMAQIQRTVAVTRLAVAVGYGLHRLGTGGDASQTLTDTLERFPGAAQGGTALVDMLGGGIGYAAMVKLLGAAGNAQAAHAGPVEVTEKHNPRSGSAPAATTIGHAARRIDELHRHGSDAAHVQAQRVVDAQGKGRWVVLVPGTQDFSANRPNPADGTGNLQSIAGHPSAMSGAVSAALTAAQKNGGGLRQG